jgi:hypothetical protein
MALTIACHLPRRSRLSSYRDRSTAALDARESSFRRDQGERYEGGSEKPEIVGIHETHRDAANQC